MRYFLAALLRNLVAGARLAFFAPVGRAAFRLETWQWLAIFVVSGLVDIALDGLRAQAGAQFTILGIDGELFALGLLMVTSGLLAAVWRDTGLFVALPIVVLAGFLPVQVVHALPAAFGVKWPPGWAARFDLLMLAWMFALCVRAAWVASDHPPRLRALRAILGGALLSLPLWVGPLGGPFEGWWAASDATDESEYPSPASEPVLAVQSQLLDDALNDLEDGRPGITDLYFVGFAPDARHEGFRAELESAQHVLDERFGTQGRSLLLLNNRATVTSIPYATLTNLRHALQEIGGAIDVDEDLVMVYLTGGSTDEHALAAEHPPLDLVDITPDAVKQLLDNAGIRYRIVVVSSCATSGWFDALQDNDTAILTYAPNDAKAPGCEGAEKASPLAEALFDRALRTADNLSVALARATTDLGPRASRLWIGPGIGEQMTRLRRGGPTRSASLTMR